MIFFRKKKPVLFWSFVGLILLGAFLRSWNYWLFPVAGETQDEYAWSILGASLLQTGVPASWSYFSGYSVYQVISHAGSQFPVVRPSLDHPPLFALIPGFAQTLVGKPWLEIVSIKLIRFPMVLLGVFNLSLFALWLWKLPETRLRPVGKLISLAVFSTAPSFVYLSRLVVSENLIVTWTLMLLLCAEVPGKAATVARNLALIALPLTKISGIATAAAEVFARVFEKTWKQAALMTGFGLALVLLYVASIDFGLFWHVQTQQAQRDTGLLTFFFTQLWSPRLVQKSFADIWVTLGYIFSLAWLVLYKKMDKSERRIAFLFIAQLAFMLLSVGETTVHGWYRIVLLPFFAYCLGWFWQKVWYDTNWIGLAVAWLLAMPIFRLGWVSVNIQQLFTIQATLSKGFIALAGASVLGEVLPKKSGLKIWRTLCLLLVLIVLSGNILTVLFLRERAYWLDAEYLEQQIRP